MRPNQASRPPGASKNGVETEGVAANFNSLLNDYEKNLLTPYIPQVDLDNADIHEDGTPWYVESAAKAETEYNDIYFKEGAYNPCSAHGIALLSHELVHVGQYRNGLTRLGYLLDLNRRQDYEVPAYDLEEKVKWALLPQEDNGSLCSCSGGK